ncbi:TetR/AcrR family transcriptional regulator [Agromyces endophyticus]|uniref:TetR/AcrR family transcriptional regulator n=1 Tax=Agromyces sp. H17E-10 TaxID=2932244 RepID=UPI001FD5BC1B|nr:TetR/AcrR family transcriptional regulator [Agromyces sp. H17E-10]UOQ87769.1 TetR/AcrR family transcriptional regulator [Agromyces sp. H17E-10]
MPSVTDAERRAPRRDAAENRESLLIAAATTLAAAPDAPLEAIAAAAGLSRRAVYGHFAGRDELVLALIERGTARLNAVASTVEHESTPVAIALLGSRLWGVVEHVRLLAGMALSAPYVERVASALAPVRERLALLVARGVVDGTVRDDLPQPLVARLIEESALAVLVESGRTGMPQAEGRRAVMLSVLGTAGLSWHEAGTLIDTTPELSRPATDAPALTDPATSEEPA